MKDIVGGLSRNYSLFSNGEYLKYVDIKSLGQVLKVFPDGDKCPLVLGNQKCGQSSCERCASKHKHMKCHIYMVEHAKHLTRKKKTFGKMCLTDSRRKAERIDAVKLTQE